MAAVTLTGASAPADARARRRMHCAHLRGRRVISNREIKIVAIARQDQEGLSKELVAYACAPPDGRVRVVGAAANEVETASIKVEAVAKKWVVLSFFGGIDPDTSEEVRKVVNAGTGASYAYSYAYTGPEDEFEPVTAVPLQERTLLNAFGQLARQIDVVGPPVYKGTERVGSEYEAEIVGIASNGHQRVLESSPFTVPGVAPSVSLLALEGHTVRWTNAGISHSATL